MLNWLDKITKGHAMEAIVIFAAFIIIKVIFSLIITSASKKKGYNEILTFFMCLIFGVCGYVVYASLPDKMLRSEIERLKKAVKSGCDHGYEGIMATSDDARRPAGTTAYMPHSVEDGARTQNSAVERIKEYWTEADEREQKKKAQAKKPAKAKKEKKEKPVKAKTKKEKTTKTKKEKPEKEKKEKLTIEN